jgi:hypothetical protein
MPKVVTIRRPDVVALIDRVANKFTAGNRTEAVALALRRLLEHDAPSGSLFGAHPRSVRIREGVDVVDPILSDELDSQTGRELSH